MDGIQYNDYFAKDQKQEKRSHEQTFEETNEEFPFVIRHQNQMLNGKTWNCVSWTLDDWAQKIPNETKFKFRVHRKIYSDILDDKNIDGDATSNINWENEASDYIEATMLQLVDHVRKNETLKHYEEYNPFSKYSLNDYSFYSAYNHLDQLLDPKTKETFAKILKWNEIGLFPEPNQHSFSSTLWIGSNGSYTPCHQDTYGYNFVVQLHGKKLWILFPPSDTKNLYSTRIPFEESSIFSQVDINSIDLHFYPRFANVQPYIVILNPGDLLHVPYHWWHYVENIPDANDLSISVNTWINHGQVPSKDHIKECVSQLLFTSLYQSFGRRNKWLNLNVELMSIEELMHFLENNKFNIDSKCAYRKPFDLQVEYLKKSNLDDLFLIKPPSKPDNLSHTSKKLRKQDKLTPKDIVNTILDPDVIDLIVEKLRQI